MEEARAVFAKHGFSVPEPVAKNSKSRTSSEMLFGDNDTNKNRETKAKSVAGSVASKRSTNGKFEGGSKFGDY